MNLIPEKPQEKSLSYWCTWYTQNIVSDSLKDNPDLADEKEKRLLFLGDQGEGAQACRAFLNEEILFGQNGWANLYPEVRKDLILVFDDGWDVDYGVHPATQRKKFGSQILSSERFPSLIGKTPAQSLKNLSDKVKSYGWRGIGIWVAPQLSSENDDYLLPYDESQDDYWIERIKWSKEAGVLYWKVDWGTHEHDIYFRRKLIALKNEIYPELLIEHSANVVPLNGMKWAQVTDETGRIFGEEKIRILTDGIVAISEVFRSYDVTPHLSVPTTLDRLCYEIPRAIGYVNGEDEVYMSVALGCSFGIMRSTLGAGKVNKVPYECDKTDEAVASVRWQRAFPAFTGGSFTVSNEILSDYHYYLPEDSWYASAYGKTICQSAPAIVARNTKLPTVTATGEKPFVTLCKNPNGVYSLATHPRLKNRELVFPRAKIEFSLDSGSDTVGVLGVIDEVIITLDKNVKTVYAQSMLEDEAVNITKYVEIVGKTVKIKGETLEKLWRPSDKSLPAIALKIE